MSKAPSSHQHGPTKHHPYPIVARYISRMIHCFDMECLVQPHRFEKLRLSLVGDGGGCASALHLDSSKIYLGRPG
jgi:hypothetical protein